MYFDDFEVGQIITGLGVTFTEGEIVHFALQYDPQPFHIDAEAAGRSQFKGLIASGFQTMALTFRMLLQEGTLSDGMGSPGIDELRWKLPVRPGDTLRTVATVLSLRASGSRTDRGYVELFCDTLNQRDESVMTMRVVQIIKRRESKQLTSAKTPIMSKC